MALKTFPVDTYTPGQPVDWIVAETSGLIVRGLVLANTTPDEAGVSVSIHATDGTHLFDVATNYPLMGYGTIELNFPTLALSAGTKLVATVNTLGVQMYASAVEDA